MKKVLVVDDDALMRYSLSAILRTEQTQVTAVETGGAALEEIERTAYDACFLDLHLPDISGRVVMETLWRNRPSTRIAIMTGGEVTGELMSAIRKQAHLFLEKPFDLREAKGFVERAGNEQETTPRYRDASGNGPVCGRRVCERVPDARTVRYVVLPDGVRRQERELAASVVDVSDTGICILTTSSLQPGQCIEVSNGSGVRRGTVRWSQAAGSGQEYRAGIQYA